LTLKKPKEPRRVLERKGKYQMTGRNHQKSKSKRGWPHASVKPPLGKVCWWKGQGDRGMKTKRKEVCTVNEATRGGRIRQYVEVVKDIDPIQSKNKALKKKNRAWGGKKAKIEKSCGKGGAIAASSEKGSDACPACTDGNRNKAHIKKEREILGDRAGGEQCPITAIRAKRPPHSSRQRRSQLSSIGNRRLEELFQEKHALLGGGKKLAKGVGPPQSLPKKIKSGFWEKT